MSDRSSHRPYGNETPARISYDRALTPIAGVLLLALTVALAATVAGAVFALDETPDDRPPRAVLSLQTDGQTLTFVHRGGDTLDVRRLRLVVAVDGEPLTHQPPLPFFSTAGFAPGPTGPFNSASDPHWSAGETATLRVAGTNQPALARGDHVTVQLYSDGALVAELDADLG